MLSGAFPEQVAFVQDESKRLFILATRRAAKSFSFGLKCITDALAHPDRQFNFLFAGLTTTSARRVFWKDVLKWLNRQYRLGIEFHETYLTATLPTGSVIHIYGADSNVKQQDRLLGMKWRGVGVDESQAWTNLETLVNDTIAPALVDDAGWLALMGTPGPLVHGFFAKVTHGCTASKLGPASLREAGWSGHAWTTLSNPYAAENFEADRKQLIADNPRVIETPSYRANWLGEWCVDESLLVYPGFSIARNTFDGTLPTFTGGEWHTICGIDLGWGDATSLTVASWHDWDKVLHVRHSYAASRMDLTDVAAMWKRLNATYSLEASIVDGSAKQSVMELVRRHGMSLLTASKTEKAAHQALLNDDLVMGRIVIDPDSCDLSPEREVKGKLVKDSPSMVECFESLIWDQKRFPKRVEHPGCHEFTHRLDSLLYLHRFAYSYLAAKPVPPPAPGTPEFYRAECERMLQAELEEMNAPRGEQPIDPGPDDPNFAPNRFLN